MPNNVPYFYGNTNKFQAEQVYDMLGQSLPEQYAGFNAGGPILNENVQALMELLAERGKTDRRASLQTQQNISQTASNQKDMVRGQFASHGLMNAGLQEAIDAAIGVGAANQISTEQANLAALEEQNQMQALSMLRALLIDPAITSQNIQLQKSVIAQGMANAEDAAKQQEMMGLMGMGLSLAGLF